MDEVRKFVETEHAGRKPRVEPLPEIKTHETFTYAAMDGPDPFSLVNLRPAGVNPVAAGGNGPQPDMNRHKEALEEYPLDSLKMVGTLSRRSQVWAIIQAPDGTVHRTQLGKHMGHNFGMITKISEEKIELVELIQGPAGNWIERASSIAIEE